MLFQCMQANYTVSICQTLSNTIVKTSTEITDTDSNLKIISKGVRMRQRLIKAGLLEFDPVS